MNREKFVSEKPVLLLGGGDVNWSVLKQHVSQGLPLVAADGAANALATNDIVPDRIVGDMDSLTLPDFWSHLTVVHQIAEQDTTDFEKCLYSTDAPAFIGFGFLGKRLDHSLAAFHVMAKYAETKPVMLVDVTDAMLVSTKAVSLDLPVGSRISVLPIAEVNFHTSYGLAWPLDGLTLTPGVMISASNSTTAKTVSIEPDSYNTSAFAVIVEAGYHDRLLAALSHH